MNIKPRYMLPTLAAFLFMGLVPIAQAETVLFDNGSFSGPQNNLRNTAETGFSQRIFDDFTLLNDAEITGFEWLQHDRNDIQYLNTEIRIYDGLPIAANLIFTTNVVATRTPNATGTLFELWDGFDYSVSGLSINLSAGTYFLGLNTNSLMGDTSWDQTLGYVSTIPGRYVANINFPEPGLFISGQDSVFKVIGSDFVEVFIDIKFCSDPNAFNCKKKGVLPVTIFGTDAFDLADVDPSTLQLCLEDLSACTDAPRNYSMSDRGDPASDLGAAMCAIDPATGQELDFLNPDGVLDLDVAFEANEVQAMLGVFCSMPKGALSEALIIKGFTFDGTPIRSIPFPDDSIDQLLKVNKSPAVECPCWTQADIQALPMEGTDAVCSTDGGRLDIWQDGICEHSYGVGISPSGYSCVTNRFSCPELPDLGGEWIETNEIEFARCLAQIINRCQELGIDPPEFP